MKNGDKAKLVVPVVEGTIVRTRYAEEANELVHLLEFKDKDGDTQQRWFLQTQLEAVEAPKDAVEG